MSPAPRVTIGLNAVIVAVSQDRPRVLTVRPTEDGGADPGGRVGLPFGPLDPEADRTLDRGLRRWVLDQTGLELGYVEQLYTFGDRDREPRWRLEGDRVLSVGYLALVREERPAADRAAAWRDVYEFLPWEDRRHGEPESIAASIGPRLAEWARAAPDPTTRRRRDERVDIVFGLGGAPWSGERVLDRYELLYEAGLVREAWRDRERSAAGGAGRGQGATPDPGPVVPGRVMALDHRRMLATALGRLRGKILYRPVVFELLAPTFTLLQLQKVVEALAGIGLHKQNFRRLVERAGLVEGTGRLETDTGGRPAELFRFRREVLREREAPGVGLPVARG